MIDGRCSIPMDLASFKEFSRNFTSRPSPMEGGNTLCWLLFYFLSFTTLLLCLFRPFFSIDMPRINCSRCLSFGSDSFLYSVGSHKARPI